MPLKIKQNGVSKYLSNRRKGREQAEQEERQAAERAENQQPVEQWLDNDIVTNLLRPLNLTPDEARWLAYQVDENPPAEQPATPEEAAEYYVRQIRHLRGLRRGRQGDQRYTEALEIPEGQTLTRDDLEENPEIQAWIRLRFIPRRRNLQEQEQQRAQRALAMFQNSTAAEGAFAIEDAQDIIEHIYEGRLILVGEIEQTDIANMIDTWRERELQRIVARLPNYDQAEQEGVVTREQIEAIAVDGMTQRLQELAADEERAHELINLRQELFRAAEAVVAPAYQDLIANHEHLLPQATLRQQEWMQQLVEPDEHTRETERENLRNLLINQEVTVEEADYVANQLAQFAGGRTMTLAELDDHIATLLERYRDENRQTRRQFREIPRDIEQEITDWLRDAEFQAWLLLLYTPDEIGQNLHETELQRLTAEADQGPIDLETVKQTLLDIREERLNPPLTLEEIRQQLTELQEQYPTMFEALGTTLDEYAQQLFEADEPEIVLARLTRNLPHLVNIETQDADNETEESEDTQQPEVIDVMPSETPEQIRQRVMTEMLRLRKEYPRGFERLNIDIDEYIKGSTNGEISPENIIQLEEQLQEADFLLPAFQERYPLASVEIDIQNKIQSMDWASPQERDQQLRNLESQLKQREESLRQTYGTFIDQLTELHDKHKVAAEKVGFTPEKYAQIIFKRKEIQDLRQFIERLDATLAKIEVVQQLEELRDQYPAEFDMLVNESIEEHAQNILESESNDRSTKEIIGFLRRDLERMAEEQERPKKTEKGNESGEVEDEEVNPVTTVTAPPPLPPSKPKATPTQEKGEISPSPIDELEELAADLPTKELQRINFQSKINEIRNLPPNNPDVYLEGESLKRSLSNLKKRLVENSDSGEEAVDQDTDIQPTTTRKVFRPEDLQAEFPLTDEDRAAADEILTPLHQERMRKVQERDLEIQNEVSQELDELENASLEHVLWINMPERYAVGVKEMTPQEYNKRVTQIVEIENPDEQIAAIKELEQDLTDLESLVEKINNGEEE